MAERKMRLGLSIRGHGYHPAAWRHPDVPADGTLHVEHYVRSAQIAESGKLDMIFFADGAGVINSLRMRGICANRPSGVAYSRNFGGDNWTDVSLKASAYGDREATVLVIGGARAGLAIAARLNQLDVDMLVVERWPRVGKG